MFTHLPSVDLVKINEPKQIMIGYLNLFHMQCKTILVQIFHWAISEIAASVHSPFCPNLADFSACVPPALQKGFAKHFNFYDLRCSNYTFTQINGRNTWHIFFASVFKTAVCQTIIPDCQNWSEKSPISPNIPWNSTNISWKL